MTTCLYARQAVSAIAIRYPHHSNATTWGRGAAEARSNCRANVALRGRGTEAAGQQVACQPRASVARDMLHDDQRSPVRLAGHACA
jgi:hypothetical protein